MEMKDPRFVGRYRADCAHSIVRGGDGNADDDNAARVVRFARD
jgi:hypothetical protein